MVSEKKTIWSVFRPVLGFLNHLIRRRRSHSPGPSCIPFQSQSSKAPTLPRTQRCWYQPTHLMALPHKRFETHLPSPLPPIVALTCFSFDSCCCFRPHSSTHEKDLEQRNVWNLKNKTLLMWKCEVGFLLIWKACR
jgi:hypothetical protein